MLGHDANRFSELVSAWLDAGAGSLAETIVEAEMLVLLARSGAPPAIEARVTKLEAEAAQLLAEFRQLRQVFVSRDEPYR